MSHEVRGFVDAMDVGASDDDAATVDAGAMDVGARDDSTDPGCIVDPKDVGHRVDAGRIVDASEEIGMTDDPMEYGCGMLHTESQDAGAAASACDAGAEGAREGARDAGQEIEPLNSSEPREATGGVVGMELIE